MEACAKEIAMETLVISSESPNASLLSEALRVDVTEVSARLALVNGTVMPASFFLGPIAGAGYENDDLSARLNNDRTRFVVIRCEAGITLVCVDAIAYVCIQGQTQEAEFLEGVGASHRAAQVRLCTGEELRGDFVSLAPPERSRLSDLLNEPGQRFMLFSSGGSTYLIHRNAVQQVSPL
jgi:hypothetical protein